MAVALAYRSPSGQRRLSNRVHPRLIALAAIVGTYLVFHLAYTHDSQPAEQASVEDDGTYAVFLGQKVRSLARAMDLRHRLGTIEERTLEQQQAVLAQPVIVAPTEEELVTRANSRVYAPDEAVRLCPDCDCMVAGAYATSPAFAVPVPKLDPLRQRIKATGSFHTRSTLRYLLHHIPLAATLDGLFLSDSTIADLLIQQYTCPDSLISFNFTGLVLDKPTQYLYTRTGPAGRLKTWEQRKPYMDRHVEMLYSFNRLVEQEGYEGQMPADARQLMWIVVEDDVSIEPGLLRLLKESGIPYLYFSFGPTRHYGKAQWNVVLRAIEVLRDGFFGDGPVLNLDDDARILPELLVKLWRLKKATAFMVGNLRSWPSREKWEGPIYEDGELTGWEVSWKPTRVFPIDMNGFAINSSMIGVGLPMSPPKYIPFDAQAGESEFLEQIYPNRTDIEPLCRNTVEEQCFYAWHNSWLREDWQDALPPVYKPSQLPQ